MKTAAQRFLWIGFLCALSAACVPEKVLSVQNYQATFMCDGGQPLRVRFAPFKAELQFQDRSVAMTQQPAAEGYRYAGSGQSLRQRGHEAVWTDNENAVHHCRDEMPGGAANPIRAPRAE